MRDVACSRKEQTENNFAAIQDADELVPRGFIVIKFYQFCDKVNQLKGSQNKCNEVNLAAQIIRNHLCLLL
jgi:hypothetical protein